MLKLTPYKSKRAGYIEITDSTVQNSTIIDPKELQFLETFDLIYRSLCAILYNFAPTSGHPGGSISSGRIVTCLLYKFLNYDVSSPDREDSDIISYAAGHKALGLYAHWALRNEIIKTAAPQLLHKDVRYQFRLEDLLGFRRNPVNDNPLFQQFKSKHLDGHPTPATPFLKLSTGASGVGLASSIGLAFASADFYGENAPYVHIIEGEGGLTPGRVSEALAAAGTASLKNVILHIDWNQASIDSNKVCRDNSEPGDYVQWNPAELTYINDWNVVYVEDGKNFLQVLEAQKQALSFHNSQPTAIVYKTIKGWNYGIEGNKSHGGGHSLCSEGYYNAIKPVIELSGKSFKVCTDTLLCKSGGDMKVVEKCYWDTLLLIREIFEHNKDLTSYLAQNLKNATQRLNNFKRTPRIDAPDISKIYSEIEKNKMTIPPSLILQKNSSTTLRGELGKVLHYYNKISNGAIFSAAADLLGSTSVNLIGQGFGDGFYNKTTNAKSRILSIGGICEDAMAGVMSGISSFGQHIGVSSSYAAFIAALGHIASRLHAIGAQSRQAIVKEPFHPFFLICAHAGIKTGEDGPTHADPQPLQLVQENFPLGTMITLTPWDPQEIWFLISEALSKRPAVICPFVTRPNEKVIDRNDSGLEAVSNSVKGVYLLHKPKTDNPDGYIVLQGSEVAYEFVEKTLPLLREKKIDVACYYISSAELFDLLPLEEQEKIFPEKIAMKAMGITGFTLPTMYRWIQSSKGRKHTMYPFKKGHYLGSGKAIDVIKEAELDGMSQFNAIIEYIRN